MNVRLTCLAAALMAVSAPALAGGDDPVKQLAQEAGLSERKVNMILGNRTSFAEYRYTYDRSVKKLHDAIGEGRYDRLMDEGNLISASVDTKARMLLAALEEKRNSNTP